LGGTAIGGLIGMPGAGASIGTDLGAALSKWLGSGDYVVKQNSIVNRAKTASGDIPMMHNTGQSVIVRHREFITDIFSGPTLSGTNTAFDVFRAYPLNPGLSTSFPWLSSIAKQYQEYSIKGMVYHYVPTSGASVASTNVALGSVMIATHYRSTAPAFTNKQFMLNEYYSNDARTSEPFCHPIECDPKENPYQVQYVRTNAVPASEDPKTYDLGAVYVATVGCSAANVNLGELWCTYEVEFKKPIPAGLTLPEALYAQWNITGITGTNPFGTAQTPTTASTTSGFVFSTGPPNRLTFPQSTVGTFLFIYTMALTASQTTINGMTFNGTNCSIVLSLGPGAATLTSQSGFVSMLFVVTITTPGLTASITCGTDFLTALPTSATLRMYEVSSQAAL